MKRILACSFLVLAFPIFTALLQSDSKSNAPFASIAIAGHTVSGGYCQCGCPGCLCDPDEVIDLCIPENKDTQQLAASGNSPAGSSRADIPAAALFLGTGLLILQRLRK